MWNISLHSFPVICCLRYYISPEFNTMFLCLYHKLDPYEKLNFQKQNYYLLRKRNHLSQRDHDFIFWGIFNLAAIQNNKWINIRAFPIHSYFSWIEVKEIIESLIYLLQSNDDIIREGLLNVQWIYWMGESQVL